jgi:energy-coupling factor transport system substrate-specific component
MSMQLRTITLVSMLATLAVVGRLYLQLIPNVQPVTAIIIICSMLLGIRKAVSLAVVSTIVSNLVLGMGIWTLWQIIAWSLIAILFGFMGKLRLPLPVNALLAGVSGLVYGLIISIPNYIFFGNFWIYYLAGLSFDISHAIGNVIFFTILYPVIKAIFDRMFAKY